MNNTDFWREGCSLLVLNQSKEGWEEKCLSSRVRTEKEPI